jgi:uncharacterized membrane-anchored protein YhcB (DUF1043 family)
MAELNWFACWIACAIGIVIGMFITSMFAGPR